MMRLNSVGRRLALIEGVHAMTDVTGFGLLGHLREMCLASLLCAEIKSAKLPLLTDLHHYIEQGIMPGGSKRNWESYGHDVQELSTAEQAIVCDPQTSGGLLVAVAPEAVIEVQAVLREAGLDHHLEPIGSLMLHDAQDPCQHLIRLHAPVEGGDEG